MNTGNVAAFACGSSFGSSGVVCERQRNHAEDHRGRDDSTGRVYAWSDPPFRPGGIVRPLPYLDEPVPLEEMSGGVWSTPYLELVLVILLIVCSPAIVVGAYRWAF